MKKVAIGCAVVLVLVGAALAGVGYYGYVKVRSAVTQLAELSKVPEIERGVQVQTPFIVPTSGELTAAQVDRFIRVTTRVRDRLGKNFETLQRNYKSLADKKDTTALDLPQLMAAYRDMAAAWLDAKRTQVAALNDAGLSLNEYRWIRSALVRRARDSVHGRRFREDCRKGAHGNPQEGVLVGGAFAGRGPASNLTAGREGSEAARGLHAARAFGL